MKYDNHIPDITRVLGGTLETNCLILFCKEYVSAFKFLKVYFEKLYNDNLLINSKDIGEEEIFLAKLIENYIDLNKSIVEVTNKYVDLDENITSFFNKRTKDEHNQIYPAIDFLKKKSLYYRSASLNPNIPPCDFHTLYLAILNYWHDEKYRLNFLNLLGKTGKNINKIEEFPIDPREFSLYDINIFHPNYDIDVSQPRFDALYSNKELDLDSATSKTWDEKIFEKTQLNNIGRNINSTNQLSENCLLDYVGWVLKKNDNISFFDLVKNNGDERTFILKRIHEIERIPERLLVLETNTGKRYLLEDFLNFDHAFEFWINVQITQHIFDQQKETNILF